MKISLQCYLLKINKQKLEIAQLSKYRELVHVSSSPPKNRSQDKRSNTRDLLGQMPVKGKQGGRTIRDHNAGLTFVKERGKEGSLSGGALDSSSVEQFWQGC